MASLLYKLGKFSLRHAWKVVAAWLLALVLAGSLAATSGATLGSNVTLDGTPAQQVIDDLQTSFKEASRGNGQVVFHRPDGKNFTTEQKLAIAAALERVKSLNAVADTVDPFETQADLNDQRLALVEGESELKKAVVELTDGQDKIEKGKVELADALEKIAEGKIALAKAQADLDKGAKELTKAQAEITANLLQVKAGLDQALAAGAPAEVTEPLKANLAALEAGQAQLDAKNAELLDGQKTIDAKVAELKAGEAKAISGQADLVTAQKKIDEGWLELEEQSPLLAAGKRLSEAVANFKTVSDDGSTAIASVLFDTQMDAVLKADKDAVVAEIDKLKSDELQIEYSQQLVQSLGSILGIGEIIGLIIAAIVLFVMLGTLIGAGLPVIAALLGVAISGATTFALASVIEMTSTTPVLGVMLGLAVGIDYSLFLLNRHRSQLKAGMKLEDSIALANGTSGNAVLFAGFTVIIALVALNLTGISFLGLMGTMGAVAIALSIGIALTFMPAVMKLVGLRVLSKKERAAVGELKPGGSAIPEVSTKPVISVKHPWLTALVTVGVLLLAAMPAQSLRLGLPDGSSNPIDSTSYKAYKLISENFGEGANGTLVVVADSAKPLAEELQQLEYQADAAEKMQNLSGVAAVVPSGISDDETKVLFQVIPTAGPNSEVTEQLVYDLRAADSSFGVTGLAAVNIDISKKLADALPLYLGTVLLLSLLLLILVFRSILVPLVASAGFLLSIFATIGLSVVVFQWGWAGEFFDIHDPGPLLSFLPTIAIGILFGLAMDYQLFLASGMREAFVHGKSPKDSINYGVHLSRSVVVAAALIMVTVFGGFVFSHEVMIRPIGFALAVGVLLDAFLVRLLLVPALLALLGKAAWWMPKWLDRILPDVDVEGAKLERESKHQV